MPSGGYGIDQGDLEAVEAALNDDAINKFSMQIEWMATYATARSKGAKPDEASMAAYMEWDL